MKRLFSLCFSVLLLAALISPAFAHRGNTDSQGGHYDHSTAEYHYHHGYSAHQHYDIDGDGDIDCPYDFHDNTDHTYGSSRSSGSYHVYITSKPTPKPTPVPVPKTAPTPSVNNSLSDTDASSIAVVLVVLILSAAFYKGTKIAQKNINEQKAEEAMNRMIAAQKAEMARIAAEAEAERKRIANEKAEAERRKFLAEKEKYTDMYGNVSTAVASGADAFCYIGKDGLPASRVAKHGERWGDWFTLYVTSNGSCYHERTCQYLHGRNVRQINGVNMPSSRYYPCSECNPTLPDMRWISEYRRIEVIRKKYDIPEPEIVS